MIFGIRESKEDSEKATFKELQRSPLVAICRRDCAPAGKMCLSLAELKEQKLIFCDPVTLAPAAAKLQWQLIAGKDPADSYFCASPDSAAVLAEAGFGMAILPALYAPQTEDIVKIQIDGSPQLSIGLFHKPYPGNPLCKRFIQTAQREFAAASDSGADR